jgi:hypothetical protein
MTNGSDTDVSMFPGSQDGQVEEKVERRLFRIGIVTSLRSGLVILSEKTRAVEAAKFQGGNIRESRMDFAI